jgi:hypothetical protein
VKVDEWQHRGIKIANKFFKHTVQIFGNDSNKSKFDQEKIKQLTSGNACYHSVQGVMSSRLLSKNAEIRIYTYKTIILPVALYWCETWSLILGEEHRLRVFKNEALRKSAMSDGDTSVGIATYYGLDGRGLIPGWGKGYLYSPQRPYRLWGSLTLPASYPVSARVKRAPSYCRGREGLYISTTP